MSGQTDQFNNACGVVVLCLCYRHTQVELLRYSDRERGAGCLYLELHITMLCKP